jgi:hypothetical protein
MCLILVVLSAWLAQVGPGYLAGCANPVAQPYVVIQKNIYFDNEAKVILIGIRPMAGARIPPHLQSAGRLFIEAPGGGTRIERIDWPCAGCPDLGWIGGERLPDLAPGTYKIRFECGGGKSRVEEITIVRKQPVGR